VEILLPALTHLLFCSDTFYATTGALYVIPKASYLVDIHEESYTV
jgi:hypothetical protein